MKKLLTILLLVVLLAPSIQASAKSTKVATPTATISYDKNKGTWNLTFNHSNSKAKIYWSDTSTKKGFKEIKQGTKLNVTNKSFAYIKARVGNTYSEVVYLNTKKLIVAKTDKDVKALAEKIIGNSTSDFSKFVKISKYCAENWTYAKRKTPADENDKYLYLHMIYDNQGVCADMSYTYQKLLNSVGVKAIYVTDDTSMKYGYEYRDDHAWNHVKIDGKWQVVDITAAACTSLGTLQLDIYGEYLDIAESNNIGLDNTRLWIQCSTYVTPVCNFLQDYPGDTTVWTDDKITCTFEEEPTLTIEIIYNKNKGYWDMYTTEDGIRTKD